jgi:type VI secretion system protein ImpK
MTPRFALAVDPIFLHVLDLIERINRGEQPNPQEERLRIRTLIDQGEAVLGASEQWELAKYAIVSWIDEMLVDAPWDGREWWSNHVFEVEMFNTRLCNERFFTQAQMASSHTVRDALEVYYNCAVLGFHGLYSDPMLADSLTRAHGLPPDLEGWAKQAAMSIRLGQGRPPLAPTRQEVRGAPPHRVRTRFVWAWLAVTMLLVLDVLIYARFIAE